MTKDFWEVHEAEWLEQQEWLAYERDMTEQAEAEPMPTEADIEKMLADYEKKC